MKTTSLAINGRRQIFALMLTASLVVSAISASYFAVEGANMASDIPALAGDSCPDVG